jgi:chromosome partitioning protein
LREGLVLDAQREEADMKVLAVTSQKGGSGKTTLCGHLAVQAEAAGQGPVAVIDTDPQGSLSVWWNAREAETPAFARTAIANLHQDLANLRAAGVRLVLIDTPPAITATILEVVRAADLVLIPVRPSPHDLVAAGPTVALVEKLSKPLVFVINGASARARITGEAAIALSQHGTVAPTIVHQRTDFAASMIDGRTVMELPKAERSREEIEGVWHYVGRRLWRDLGDQVLPTGHTIAEIEAALANPAAAEQPTETPVSQPNADAVPTAARPEPSAPSAPQPQPQTQRVETPIPTTSIPAKRAIG